MTTNARASKDTSCHTKSSSKGKPSKISSALTTSPESPRGTLHPTDTSASTTSPESPKGTLHPTDTSASTTSPESPKGTLHPTDTSAKDAPSSPTSNTVLASDLSVPPVTEPVVVSDSPGHPVSTWIKDPFLTLYDKSKIENPYEWLSDAIINAAQQLLKQQSNCKIGGFQNTNYGKGYRFQHEEGDFVQVLHVSKSHWITVSNIGCSVDTINVFDSAYAFIDMDGRKQISSIIKPKGDTLTLNFVNIQHQGNGSDCGLFALACATDIVHGRDPFLSYWDTKEMRSHFDEMYGSKTDDMLPLGEDT